MFHCSLRFRGCKGLCKRRGATISTEMALCEQPTTYHCQLNWPLEKALFSIGGGWHLGGSLRFLLKRMRGKTGEEIREKKKPNPLELFFGV